ncbi:MAG TPA: HEPN domain-containing protein [Dehalococcoidia bacterium]|nr:HEPN domain-containing protein [Dehalococcoidia bacterium]
MTEAERHIRKARESLASARADVRAKRHNSAANRAYYAAFQAAVAALLRADIRPAERTLWQHRFVLSQFSGTLVRRRKRLPSDLPARMAELLRLRLAADYGPDQVTARDAARSLRHSTRIVEGVERMTQQRTLREASAEHEAKFPEGQAALDLAERRIEELEALIRGRFPEAAFDVWRTGPKDYRLTAYIPRSDFGRITRALSDRLVDILVDDDIWIVAMPEKVKARAR